MSRDKPRNLNTSFVESERSEGKLSSMKNFDSHEKSNENMSNEEDMASNEAISGEVIEKAQDKEVRNGFCFEL